MDCEAVVSQWAAFTTQSCPHDVWPWSAKCRLRSWDLPSLTRLLRVTAGINWFLLSTSDCSWMRSIYINAVWANPEITCFYICSFVTELDPTGTTWWQISTSLKFSATDVLENQAECWSEEHNRKTIFTISHSKIKTQYWLVFCCVAQFWVMHQMKRAMSTFGPAPTLLWGSLYMRKSCDLGPSSSYSLFWAAI